MRLGDLDALKHKFTQISYIRFTADMGQGGWNLFSEKEIEKIIDSAPELGYEDGILSVETATRRAIELEEAYNNGWSDGFSECENERPQGEWVRKEDVIHSIAEQYSAHNELVPIWLSIGDIKGGAE